MTEGGNNCLLVMVNFRKAEKSLLRMTRILGWEGTDLRVFGMFFKAVVQAVLLFCL